MPSKIIQIPCIIIDTQEQLPYSFKKICPHDPPKTKRVKLKTGDYSLEGCEHLFTIERKTLSDLFGSLSPQPIKNQKETRRGRLQKEFERMSQLKYSALIIEAKWTDVFDNPPKHSKMNPKSVFRSVLAWSCRYGVHVHWGIDREKSEKITYITIKNFWRYYGQT